MVVLMKWFRAGQLKSYDRRELAGGGGGVGRGGGYEAGGTNSPFLRTLITRARTVEASHPFFLLYLGGGK